MRTVVPLAILAAAGLAFRWLAVEPPKPKAPPAKKQALRTQVRKLQPVDHAVVIRTQGIIRPHNEVNLTSQIPGRIVRIAPGLEDGAFFADGEVLLELDAVDYETAVVAAEAQVARTRAAHALEETRARQARLNWEDLGYKEEPNELVLRLPQLREAKANVDAALAQLERARRDLERTKIRAPFAGRVRRRSVGLGQVIGAGSPLASVFSTDVAEVRLPIAGREMPFLRLPETPSDPAVEVELRGTLEGGEATSRRGRIVRTEGVLDENSLDLFAIARIEDPFGRTSGQAPLRIGQPVIGLIRGKVLTNVMLLPRGAVRQLDQILLVDPDALTLQNKTIVPLWADEEHLVVRDAGLPAGSLLATTHLVFAPNGSKVEIIPDIPGPALQAAPNGGTNGSPPSAASRPATPATTGKS